MLNLSFHPQMLISPRGKLNNVSTNKEQANLMTGWYKSNFQWPSDLIMQHYYAQRLCRRRQECFSKLLEHLTGTNSFLGLQIFSQLRSLCLASDWIFSREIKRPRLEIYSASCGPQIHPVLVRCWMYLWLRRSPAKSLFVEKRESSSMWCCEVNTWKRNKNKLICCVSCQTQRVILSACKDHHKHVKHTLKGFDSNNRGEESSQETLF